MNVSFQFAALHYLNLWLSKERRLHESFQNSAQSLGAIAEGANHFRVARTLPKKFDAGKRYRPALEILNKLDATTAATDPINAVLGISRMISPKYGGASVLSFTTKMLWLKFRSPIIIYDGQARMALEEKTNRKLPRGDYNAYCEAWHAELKECRTEIKDACASLVNVRDYAIDDSLRESELQNWARSRWFQERVFDSYLWHLGNL